MKKIKIFPIGINDGETPGEVEQKVNKLLEELYKKGIEGKIGIGGDFIVVIWKESEQNQ